MYIVFITSDRRSWYFASFTTPTISYGTRTDVTRRPSGEPAPKKYRAKLSFTIATFLAEFVSRSSNSLPLSKGVPTVEKYFCAMSPSYAPEDTVHAISR
jgi:hypothetical protein